MSLFIILWVNLGIIEQYLIVLFELSEISKNIFASCHLHFMLLHIEQLLGNEPNLPQVDFIQIVCQQLLELLRILLIQSHTFHLFSQRTRQFEKFEHSEQSFLHHPHLLHSDGLRHLYVQGISDRVCLDSR